MNLLTTIAAFSFALGVLIVVHELGHYFVALALGFAPANIVTPFQYVQMLGSVLIGYLFWGDLPDAFTWLGAAIVVGSGLCVGWTQTRRQTPDAPSTARRSPSH